ncbi:conserved hypothetical protein [Dinoroseobacter shibae DFL 12 = DSM 16493]|jgi:hypothetical protein|uniref:Uncharacterized protein n=1 Tax=Dinoroseobacter shibae (strain DSM 16493 / NCIMB 14021 / DFL 12) TaxID=398580 RepID=A8LSE8_DINSH|nr:hypothetical protein [Dinoroseobacter shibae]ABV92762.1 conserved hypothetical protein [Dinoroseobacter shibae DFL 12 = DSM 16493]URF47705.1 hypothetical protein M8008_05310 [Dinoroseobacter shibae]URF52015.1 hypothetical protein M8007_05310 [Dinoroseobacter shibae]
MEQIRPPLNAAGAAPDLAGFLARGREVLRGGPVALIFAEDGVELASTLAHHLAQGFRALVLFAPDHLVVPEGLDARIHRVRCDRFGAEDVAATVTAVARRAPGTWFYYGFNAEYLFYPYCETRSVGEMLAFHTEERRDAMLTYVVDLYAGDLGKAPSGVCRQNCYMDRSGYYALERMDARGIRAERQYDFYGGLRWRFEEHVPATRRRIDRIALFRARPGLTLRADHTFSDPEYNTVSCAWHHNLTGAVCSFRAAKALKANPGSSHQIPTFWWQNSVWFEWKSTQLLGLGLIEPGQWF